MAYATNEHNFVKRTLPDRGELPSSCHFAAKLRDIPATQSEIHASF
jgi:hypothetical protein